MTGRELAFHYIDDYACSLANSNYLIYATRQPNATIPTFIKVNQ